MMSKTPARVNKPAARRKLSSPQSKIKPLFPVNKKPKVDNAKEGRLAISGIDTSAPKQNVLIEYTPTKRLALDDELCSQESFGGLPRITWQAQQINSPLLSDTEDARDSDSFCNVKIDSPKPRAADASSTPYFKKIWRGSKAKFSSVTSSAECLSSKDEADKSSNAAWFDRMYSLVSQLDDQNSRSPTPELASALSSQHTKVSRKGGLGTPPNVLTSNSQATHTSIRSLTPSVQSQQGFSKPETNSSLFSDSLDEFAGDFTLSDGEESACPPEGKRAEPASIPTIQSKFFIPVGEGSSQTFTGIKPSNTQTYDASKLVKPEPKGPALESTPALSVKLEPKTPPAVSFRKRTGSPGTPLRRYNSDGVIKSPSAKESTVTERSEKNTHDLIEQKRKLALTKLKSRKGSFVKHKSLDSMTALSRRSQPVMSQGSASDVSTKTLQLIEEKRKMAAERLQKHREVEKDRFESLSGTLQQLTPPSSQDNSAVVNNTASTETASQNASTSSRPSSSLSDHSSKTSEIKTSCGSQRTVSKDTSSQKCSESENIVFSGKITLDSLLDDLENNSPSKPKVAPDHLKVPTLKQTKTVITNPSPSAVVATSLATLKHSAANPPSAKRQQQPASTVQNGETPDERIRKIIEEKRKAAVKKLRLSKQQKGS